MNKKILVIISVILLLVCCMDLHVGYGIYQILRWVVSITGIVLAIDNYKKVQWKFVACCIITVLFNPIAPIYLTKEIWVSIDICTAIAFLCAIFL